MLMYILIFGLTYCICSIRISLYCIVDVKFHAYCTQFSYYFVTVNLLYNVCTYYRIYQNYSPPINTYPTLE